MKKSAQKLVKLLSKKNFSIVLIILSCLSNLYAEEKPVDIWNIDDEKIKETTKIEESVLKNIEDESKSQGLKFLFTVCGNVHMENIHNKLGWTIDKSAPAYESFKYI